MENLEYEIGTNEVVEVEVRALRRRVLACVLALAVVSNLGAGCCGW